MANLYIAFENAMQMFDPPMSQANTKTRGCVPQVLINHLPYALTSWQRQSRK